MEPDRTEPPDAYTQARRVQPGCQHHLGCKCGVPYYLRPSSPAELRRERLLQLSSTQYEFLLAGLAVVERRRDELKREVERLCALQSSASVPAPGTSLLPNSQATSTQYIPQYTSVPIVKRSGPGSESVECGTPGPSVCPVSAVLPHAGSVSQDLSSVTWPTPEDLTRMRQIYNSCGLSLLSFSRVNSTST